MPLYVFNVLSCGECVICGYVTCSHLFGLLCDGMLLGFWGDERIYLFLLFCADERIDYFESITSQV